MKAWARVFDTAHGQLLMIKAAGGSINILGQPTGDMQPLAHTTFEDDAQRDVAFDAATQQNAEEAAAMLVLATASAFSQVGNA